MWWWLIGVTIGVGVFTPLLAVLAVRTFNRGTLK